MSDSLAMVRQWSLIQGSVCFFCIAFLLSGCAITSSVPVSWGEIQMYRMGSKTPDQTCEHGYQKIYYIVKNEDDVRTRFTKWRCLSKTHIGIIEELGTVDPASKQSERQIEIRRALSLTAPDLSKFEN